MEQFFFCCRFDNLFAKLHQLSRTLCVSVRTDGASAIIRIKTTLLFYEKGKLKYFGSYCLLRREKIRQQRNLRSLTVFKRCGKEHTGHRLGRKHWRDG